MSGFLIQHESCVHLEQSLPGAAKYSTVLLPPGLGDPELVWRARVDYDNVVTFVACNPGPTDLTLVSGYAFDYEIVIRESHLRFKYVVPEISKKEKVKWKK